MIPGLRFISLCKYSDVLHPSKGRCHGGQLVVENRKALGRGILRRAGQLCGALMAAASELVSESNARVQL